LNSREDAERAWLETIPARAGAPALYIFPHAGAGAGSYLSWARALGPSCALHAVRYPGRERLVREPFWPSVDCAVASLAERIPRGSSTPYVLFGHSLGALLAFELARELRRRGSPPPALLIVSGSRAPEFAARIPPVSGLSDEDFVAAVSQRYALLPRELLRDAAALKYYTDLMRADIRLVERYAYRSSKPLACDVEVLCGRSDPLVTEEMAQAWSGHGRRARVSWYEGDHFFIHQSKNEVIDHLRPLLVSAGLLEPGVVNVGGGVS